MGDLQQAHCQEKGLVSEQFLLSEINLVDIYHSFKLGGLVQM